MKELYQSRTFRRNLRKWIFMYIATLGIFTSIITYSKFISQPMGEDEVRVAKFDVQITYLNDECTNVDSPTACNTLRKRPLENYEFYFAVDTSNVEVAATIAITPETAEALEVAKIYELNQDLSVKNELSQIVFDYYPDDTNKIRYYKIVTNHEIELSDYNTDNKSFERVLVIGYSALQIN